LERFEFALASPLNVKQLAEIYYYGGFPDSQGTCPTILTALVCKEVKKGIYELSLDPSPEECQESFINYLTFLWEDLQ
jgi:hypothetical protein